jgi:hypothetical protein
MAKDLSHWSSYEAEVALYYANEEGVSAQSYEPQNSPTLEPKAPRFAPGVDPYMMFTTIDRLREADKDMPCTKRGVAYVFPELSAPPIQVLSGDYQPSASMVLRAAYGVLSCKYDDSAPNGVELLKQAKRAYVKAAQRVPRRRPQVSAKDKLNARFDRAFAGGDD